MSGLALVALFAAGLGAGFIGGSLYATHRARRYISDLRRIRG